MTLEQRIAELERELHEAREGWRMAADLLAQSQANCKAHMEEIVQLRRALGEIG